MNQTLKISGTNGANFTLPIHVHLHDTLYNIVNIYREKLSALNDTLFGEWRRCIDVEIGITREIRKSLETAKMQEKDRERNYYVKYLFTMIRLERQSPDALRRMAAKRLMLIVDAFKKIRTRPANEKHLLIVTLIDALMTDDAKAMSVQTLALNGIVTKLQEANQAWLELFDQRTEAIASRIPQSSREIRRETDDLYNMVKKTIEISCNVDANSADRTEIEDLIRSMNEQIAEEKTTFKLIQSHKKPRKKKEEADPSEMEVAAAPSPSSENETEQDQETNVETEAETPPPAPEDTDAEEHLPIESEGMPDD